MYFQLVDSQVLSTQGQPDEGVNLHRLTADGERRGAAPQPAHTRQTPQQNYHSFPTQEHFEALSDKGIALVDVEEVLALARRFIQGPERTEPPGES